MTEIRDGITVTVALADAVAPGHHRDRIIAQAAHCARIDMVATVVHAEPALIPAARDRARALLDLVDEHARGLCRFHDLTLEYGLIGPHPTRARAASPHDADPELTATLACLARYGFNRKAAAEDVQLDPDTLQQWLDRIALRTGRHTSHPFTTGN